MKLQYEKVKEENYEEISELEIEEILQRAYLHFTPEDFVKRDEDGTQEPYSEKD